MTKSDAKRVGINAYRTLGTMPDGVVILAPKLAPTHFKVGQIRSTIAKLGRATADAKVAPPKAAGRGDKPAAG